MTDYCRHFPKSFWQERTLLPWGQPGCAVPGPSRSPCCRLGSLLACNSPKAESEEKESRSPVWAGRVNFCVDFSDCVATSQWKLCFLYRGWGSALTPSVPQSKAVPFPFTSVYKRCEFKPSLSFFLPYVPARLQFSRGYNLGSFSSHRQQTHL